MKKKPLSCITLYIYYPVIEESNIHSFGCSMNSVDAVVGYVETVEVHASVKVAMLYMLLVLC